VRRPPILGLLLALVTLAAFAEVLRFDFVNFDDPGYVTSNQIVQRGITLRGLAWAFTTGHLENWHPLTWLSHMLDCELYGLEPAGHHATSLVFHGLDTLLLFEVLRRMTAAPRRSALVAALFALHPLHVESVAWIAERKDVLSTFFWLLAMGAWVGYVRRPGLGRYALVALWMALGLLAKPMLVTLPAVLLLLDHWPLRRPQPFVKRLIEKLPLFALSLASCVVTLVFQRRAMGSEPVAFPLRLANAVVAYVEYLEKTLWPVGLSVLYPHPFVPGAGGTPLPGWRVAAALLFLLAVTAWVLCWLRRGYASVGWLWYLGTLVPVLGLVQVGTQALADRYTYVPLIGLFIFGVWGGAELIERLRTRLPGLGVASAVGVGVLLLACLALSRAQARHWRDSTALFERALTTAPRSAIVRHNLGLALQEDGRLADATEQFREAVRLEPRFTQALNSLGFALQQQGDLDAAIRYFERAVAVGPHSARSHVFLGGALEAQGRLDLAIEQYRQALEVRPDLREAQTRLANALRRRDAGAGP
jgi:hypothetical protein